MNTVGLRGVDQGNTIVQQISQTLLSRILSKAIRPGDRINENLLATEFNVSRGPIREALRAMELSHLVEVIHNKGAFVRKLDIAEVLHLYDVRVGLAYTAGKLLARRTTAEQIAKLYALCQSMEEKREQKDSQGYVELNEQFHATLMSYTGNPRLIEWSKILDQELRVFLRGGTFSASRMRTSNEEHLALVKCIDAGDAQGAALNFEEHISKGRVRALDSMITTE